MRWLLLTLALCGCPQSPETARVDKKKERQEASEAIASKTPVPRTYQIGGNQLVTIDVSHVDEFGYVDVQTCYIWRDQEFKTASMQCPSEQSAVTIPGGPTFDHH